MNDPANISPGSSLPRIGHGSLTEQTTQALLRAILDRSFPNDRLPNEPDLAVQMGVSRTTIRAALHTLDRLGVISRTPGRGTQLRPHIGRDSMMLHRLIGFQGMLEARYGDVRVKQTFDVQDQASTEAMAALRLGADVPVVVNDKTYYADGRPAVHLLQEVPLAYVADELAGRIGKGENFEHPATIFEFSQFWPGREIDHSVVDLVPEVARRGKALPLPLKAGTPYLALHEIHYSEANEPIAYSREIIDGDAVRLRLVRTR